jgi:hypothetical protein
MDPEEGMSKPILRQQKSVGLFLFRLSTPFLQPIRSTNPERQPIAALHICTGMLERGEIDVAVTDLSLTFPRAQVTRFFNYSLPVLIVLADFLKVP